MFVNIRSTNLLAFWFLLVASLGMSLAWAQEDEGGRQDRSLTPNVARDLLEAFEMMEEGEDRAALTKLNELMARRGENMKPFDRASVLQIRGSANVNVENLDAGLNDFAEALELNALPAEQNSRLRFNLAQLYFVTERYEESIEFFNRWLREDDSEAGDNTYFMLGAAYYHLDRYQEALDPINRAIELSEEPVRRYYDLKNVLLNELGRVPPRTELLKEMVALWPDELSYWRQLSSLYLEQGMEYESFGIMESAYLSGLLESESDITLLAQFYSNFNNPHRGAELIEKEIENGRVERSVDNLQLLSQLWSQAREHSKAIPVLREAARMSDTGELSFRLGQSLLADERNEEAERAFEAAIDKGELDDKRLAEVWILLGTARFNQAGPGDKDQREAADRAFAQAERYASARAQAREWRGYIRAINETETRQAMLEEEQGARMEAAAQERFLQSCRAMQIAGRELSEECRQVLGDTDEMDDAPEPD